MTFLEVLKAKGFSIITEAATDVIEAEQLQGITEPWKNPAFIDQIINLQKQRQIENSTFDIQLYDRSPICTYALSVFLGLQLSSVILKEIERIKKENIYDPKVFFVENLGFCKASSARKISFKESLIFEKIHEDTYTKFGYQCIKIQKCSVIERAEIILKLVS